jgi:hypothetical protein
MIAENKEPVGSIPQKFLALGFVVVAILGWLAFQFFSSKKVIEVPASVLEVELDPLDQIDQWIAAGEDRKALGAMLNYLNTLPQASIEWNNLKQEIEWSLYGGGTVDMNAVRTRIQDL